MVDNVQAEQASSREQDRVRLLSRILTHRYGDKWSPAQVARQLGISEATVNRLLKQAKQDGLIEISLRLPLLRLPQLEASLNAIFESTDMVVLPAADTVAGAAHALGQAGAGYLLANLRDGDVIGVGGGAEVHAVIHALSSPRTFDVQVVPLLGTAPGQPYTDVDALAFFLAEKLGGTAHLFRAPAFVESPQQRDLLLASAPLREILDRARQADIALISVGAVSPLCFTLTTHECRSPLIGLTGLSEETLCQIAESCKAVGELVAQLYDIRGRPCAQEFSGRLVGLTLAELKGIPLVIGVAATAVKAMAIYGALRGRHLHTLITDEPAARGVLGEFERDFRRRPQNPPASAA